MNQEETYIPEKISKEVNANDETNLSEILESVSKSVVRHIKNNSK